MIKDSRLNLLIQWLSQFDYLTDITPIPLDNDASFRRYFRIIAKKKYIVMDAPPEFEDCKSFVQISRYLSSMGLNCPRVIEADFEQGFLLLTDLGSVDYLSEIKAYPQRSESLYKSAIECLLIIQEIGVDTQSDLPLYDSNMLQEELNLFRDWLCKRHLNIVFTSQDDYEWNLFCNDLIENIIEQPRVFVHRDYHSRNLMVLESNNIGILDFQDAVEGPYTYDLVSLLKDCYIKFPDKVIKERAKYFFIQKNKFGINEKKFFRDFDLMGVQRHMKAAGIFARLYHRDGKERYLADIPRTLEYIVDLLNKYEVLDYIQKLISYDVIPRINRRT